MIVIISQSPTHKQMGSDVMMTSRLRQQCSVLRKLKVGQVGGNKESKMMAIIIITLTHTTQVKVGQCRDDPLYLPTYLAIHDDDDVGRSVKVANSKQMSEQKYMGIVGRYVSLHQYDEHPRPWRTAACSEMSNKIPRNNHSSCHTDRQCSALLNHIVIK